MSRLSILSEAVGKIQELENLTMHQNRDYAKKRIPFLLKELQDLRFTNVLCGETAINNWYLGILRGYANFKNEMQEHEIVQPTH